jgi:Fur family transcriptional regulator, ferric uptake regulator
MSCSEETDRALRAAGLRRTVPRSVVLSTLRHAGGHRTVEALHEALLARHPEAAGIARSTVYRTLETLEDAGLVVAIRSPQAEMEFEWPERPHHHLVCEACGTSDEVALDSLDALRSEMASEHGFSAEVRHLAVRGLCSHCQETRA